MEITSKEQTLLLNTNITAIGWWGVCVDTHFN